MDEVFNLCNKFPVEYDYDYEDILIHDVDLECLPHIELENKNKKSVGYIQLDSLKNYETTIVIVRFNNVNIKNYTASYHVIENSYVDLSVLESYKYVDVEWGEWVESDAIELKITKNNSERIGALKIKVYVKQNSEIVAYIQY